MGQTEVLAWLKNKRSYTDKYFITKEVAKGLQENGVSNGSIKNIHHHLFKLTCYGYLDCKGVGLWKHHKTFRAKKV